MRYRINQIKLNIDKGPEDFPQAIRKTLKKKNLDIRDITIVKESIDARKKPDVKLVYTLDFTTDTQLELDEAKVRDYDKMLAEKLQQKEKNGSAHGPAEKTRPVIAGFGPCGMFAALILAEAGKRPVVLERGEDVDSRIGSVQRFWNQGILDTESNVQFGEGGAGTFSDGKLTTGIKDIRISKVLREFVNAGADEAILYKQKPHIGTDQLIGIVKNIRKKIIELGGEIRFNTRLDQIIMEKKDGCSSVKAIRVCRTLRKTSLCDTPPEKIYEMMDTDTLILAIGHSARDTFQMLYDEGMVMEQKPFSIGVRIEHPQEMIDASQYGDPKLAEKLGAADYKLNHKCQNGRGVYTFCMCPGGEVINASSEAETAVTNGMSNSARDSYYANSGLLVDVRTSDFDSEHPLAGVEFQRKYEHLAYENGCGKLPVTDYGAFRKNTEDPVRNSLPRFASEAIIEAMPHLGRKLRGFDRDDARMTAVETRSSSPVRIKRDEGYQSSIRGVYPAGEGPGYAGGIMSAAVDGIRTAEKIMGVIIR